MALRYPKTVDSAGAPYVTFSFRKPSGEKSSAPDIVLFMPPAFQITDGQDYEFTSKGTISQILGALGGGGEGTLRGLLSLLGNIPKLSTDYAETLALSGEAVRDPKFFNYKEPKAREFTFNYKFEPKNKEDASDMLSIINTFRYASYPTALPGGKMYGVPDSVVLTFTNVKTGFEEQLSAAGLVIKEINTTLSEGEQMLTFKDGTPTQVSLQIQFAETALLTKDTSGKLAPLNTTGSRTGT
jgi:hypothetical protein